jgi:hypothetical protein
MDRRIVAILGTQRAKRIAMARSLPKAMDAAGLEHYSITTQSLFWVSTPQGGGVLGTIEKLPANQGWTVWMQPPALGLKMEREWKFEDRTSAVTWLSCFASLAEKGVECIMSHMNASKIML